MLVTGKNLRCSRCKRVLTTRTEKSRLYVETDRQGTLKVICPMCYRG